MKIRKAGFRRRPLNEAANGAVGAEIVPPTIPRPARQLDLRPTVRRFLPRRPRRRRWSRRTFDDTLSYFFDDTLSYFMHDKQLV
jgi:hypothetical protein